MRLFLVRHGAVVPPRPHAFYGGTDVPLSAAGREEAARAADSLRQEAVDLVVSSPLGRARFGAARLQQGRGVPLRIEPDLREIDRGRWVGLTPEEVRSRFPGDLESYEADPEHWCGHGGESLGALRDRVLLVRDRLLPLAGEGGVALVAHLFPIRALLADALGLPLARWKEIRVPTASISRVDYTPGSAEVLFSGRKPGTAAGAPPT